MAWKGIFSTRSAPSVVRIILLVIGKACMLSCVASLPLSNQSTGLNETVVASVSPNEVDSAVNVLQSWTVVVFTLFAAILNFKAPMLWAESRMLRKLKSPNRGEVEWIASVKQSMPQQERRSFEKVFAHSVVSLSKGRHTPYGRLYHAAYRLFMLSMDMVIVVLGVDVLTSEAVIALRLLIYSGSLSVLGAQRFTTGTYFWLFWPSALFASLVIADGFVPKWKPSWSYLVPTVLIAISISVDLLFGARAIAFALKQHDVDMFSITNRILNGENLTKNQQGHINCILENPKCLKTKNNKYWRFSYETVFEYIMLILVAFSILLYDISPTQRPFFFVINTFEIIAETLFILNDAQVAPTLFEELVHRASRQTRALLD